MSSVMENVARYCGGMVDGRTHRIRLPFFGRGPDATADDAGDRSEPRGTSAIEPEAFLAIVEDRLADRGSRGTLAYVEVVGPHHEQSSSACVDPQAPGTDYAELFDQIGRTIGPDDIFCHYGGRFIILIGRPASARSVLSRVSRVIANRTWTSNGADVHLTPIIGFLDLRAATSVRDLWAMAEEALVRARSSLEIEPSRYRKVPPPRDGDAERRTPLHLWKRAPQWFALSTQLVLSLLLGLAAPFLLYAVCDALGKDISGPVYIGVVVVLVITATTIWIEGLLALRATAPPAEPGSPYPVATVIIPAYLPNEAETIVETLHAFLRLDYRNTVQIILAYNCPAPHLPVEDALRALAAEQEGGRFLIDLIRVEGSTSKAQNVNAVVGRVRGSFVGIFDADHHPHPDSLERAWRWLSNGWDIVQGRCSIRNGTDSWVARMVAVEFEQIYAVSHPGRARLHGFGIFGGSNGFWRTAVLHETRMRHSMLTEDIDSSIRAVVAGYRITGDRDLVSEELAPTSMKQLLNQRLRWAQGWFQVSWRRVMPALASPHVTIRQKLGLIHLLVWRELFPWYSIQVVPIMIYWVWIYGWAYIHWTIPVFLLTTVYTVSTGPGQIVFAYLLAQKSMRQRPGWFVEYLVVSTLFYSPFKDALSRIAHVKEAMREKAWKVTPRAASTASPALRMAATALGAALLTLVLPGDRASAQGSGVRPPPASGLLATLLGGEASTIAAARAAASQGRNAEAARLFEKAIRDVPGRRTELLPDYADALSYAGRSAEAVPLYRELLATPGNPDRRRDLGAHLALALAWSRQYGAALTVYDGLLARAPSDADLLVHRASVLVRLGRPDAAVAALDAVPAARWRSGPLGDLGNDVLVECARDKARAGQRDAAVVLFARVMQRDSRRRAALMPEYAAELPGAIPPAGAPAPDGDPVARYRRMLAHAAPGTPEFLTAQRGLALASTSDDQALAAWTAYLRYAPRDADATLHQAALLSRLHRADAARDAFRTAYALDGQNPAARRGLFDAEVALARAAAQADRNAEAAALFADAIRVDPRRRGEVVREYADQLSFTGHAADAVPLFREAIAAETVPAAERKAAMIGLADAYQWSDRLPESLATWTQLAAAYPDDAGLRWSMLVVGARDAARTNRNAESAKLFGEAMALDPVRASGLAREYADQLSFTERAAQAIPYYQQALALSGLSAAERLAARGGLARAYDWSGRYAQAEAAYQQLATDAPDDVGIRWHLLVSSARDAAQGDRNRDAATLFAKAIRLDPEHSASILADYADQLCFTGRSESAVGFYQAVLRQSDLTAARRSVVDRDLARAYDWSGRYADAAAAYAALSAAAPSDQTLRWQFLVASARDAATHDRNKEAARLFAQAIGLLPARRNEILKEYADKLAYGGEAKAAVPLYREAIANGGTGAAVRDASLALASALATDRQYDSSLREYRRLTSADPNDTEAAIGAARTLSWQGRQPDAKLAYQQVLARFPGNGDAQRGLAEAEDWQGHHRAAQLLLTDRLRTHPDDVAAHRLLAQSLIWSGQPDRALDEVHRALLYEHRPARRDPPSVRPVRAAVGLSLTDVKERVPTVN